MNPQVRTARTAGALYLAFIALVELVGVGEVLRLPYAVNHPDGPSAAGWVTWPIVGVEVLVAVARLLAAVWLGRLFRGAAGPAAAWIVPLGVAGAVVQLLLAASRASDAVHRPWLAIHHARVGADILFPADAILFTLWMTIIGWCVWRSRLLPRALGALLIAATVANLMGVGLLYLDVELAVADYALAGAAFAGDLWLAGYLLSRGVRRNAVDETAPEPEVDPEFSGR